MQSRDIARLLTGRGRAIAGGTELELKPNAAETRDLGGARSSVRSPRHGEGHDWMSTAHDLSGHTTWPFGQPHSRGSSSEPSKQSGVPPLQSCVFWMHCVPSAHC